MPIMPTARPKWRRLTAASAASGAGILLAYLWTGHVIALALLAALLVGAAQQGLP